MRVKEERGGWFIEAETSDEQRRLKWLIESLQSHPDQQPCETGSGRTEGESDRLDAEIKVLNERTAYEKYGQLPERLRTVGAALETLKGEQ